MILLVKHLNDLSSYSTLEDKITTQEINKFWIFTLHEGEAPSFN